MPFPCHRGGQVALHIRKRSLRKIRITILFKLYSKTIMKPLTTICIHIIYIVLWCYKIGRQFEGQRKAYGNKCFHITLSPQFPDKRSVITFFVL